MQLLMVSSEVHPFAKSGGLADMVPALAGALKKMGEDVRVLSPLYQGGPREELKRQGRLLVDMGHYKISVGLLEGRLGEVPLYLLEEDMFFGRKGLYGPSPSLSYSDNYQRFTLLSRAFVALCEFLNWIPQVVHGHDWPCGPLGYFLSQAPGAFRKSASVFTIHNMGYQGNFFLESLAYMGITPQEAQERELLHRGAVNFLKMALKHSDFVTTVSPTYSREICTPRYGETLEEELEALGDRLIGILNGADYRLWDPSQDEYLAPHYYSPSQMEGKRACKARLQQAFDLPQESETPLFAMVSRLVEQKGVRSLCGPTGILPEFCATRRTQVVILGTGEEWVERELCHLEGLYPNLGVKIGYDEGLSHLIEGGADFFMMPSLYEPCGLSQLYSLKYGTVPIVRGVGGLVDTVKDPGVDRRKATGFVYPPQGEGQLLKALDRALLFWETQPDYLRQIQQNGMKAKVDWQDSASCYKAVYEKTMQN